MVSSFYLQITSLAFILILTIIFSLKSKIKSIEIKYFSLLLYTVIFELSSELLLELFELYNLDDFSVILVKIYAIALILFNLLFTKYLYHLEHSDDKIGKFNIIHNIIFVIFAVIAIFLPMTLVRGDNTAYASGQLISFLAVVVTPFYSVNWVILIFKNMKKISFVKFLPILFFIIGGIIMFIIQILFPGLVITTTVEALSVFLMYFTIENPDVKMIEQLNIARDQADRANNAKSDFLSSMSHEIRTPLNAIVGFSQALSEEDLPLQAKEEVKDIMMASDTLLDIVNGILDISKIEANKLEIVNTEYNFNSVLEELVSLSKARLGEKPLDFRYSFSPDIPKYMLGDKVRVKQVILNLLTNAIKYTHEGWIEFKVNCVNKDGICRLIISVQDTGIGIKQESINKLFNRFERLDVEKNNTIEGTGLGLAITKKLIELMGGQIVVQSIYGEGSKFTIAIDQKIVTNPTNPNLERTQMLDLSAIKNIDLTNRRILIVDDNKINLKVASRLLQDYHCIIDTLDSGIECVEKIGMGASYDLILMDDMMPKQGGVETFHKLKEIEGFNTPVIALTANAISGMREKYLAEGFNDYLSKPIDKTELNRVLNKFLK